MAFITHITNHKGVTLVEIVIGTAIMALLAEFAAVNFIGQLPTRRLNGAIQQVVWDLRAARMRAINQNQNVIVTFISDHEYAIGPDLNNNGVLDGAESETIDIRSQYASITFTDPLPAPFTFNPRGLSNISPVVTLTNHRDTRRVTVTLVGHVEVD